MMALKKFSLDPKPTHVSVQRRESRGIRKGGMAKAQHFQEEYLGRQDVRVRWVTCDQFAMELERRWKGVK
jgi:hypothetical protein